MASKKKIKFAKSKIEEKKQEKEIIIKNKYVRRLNIRFLRILIKRRGRFQILDSIVRLKRRETKKLRVCIREIERENLNNRRVGGGKKVESSTFIEWQIIIKII